MTHPHALSLVVPALAHEREYLAMIEEFIAAGEGYPFNNAELALRDYPAYVRELEEEALGIGLPSWAVPQQSYLLLLDGTTVVGECRFRPHLTPAVMEVNGHVGYNIRPAYRGRGYATRQLALLLDEARAAGLACLRLVVEGERPASVRVIANNGGHLRFEERDPASGERRAHFDLPL